MIPPPAARIHPRQATTRPVTARDATQRAHETQRTVTGYDRAELHSGQRAVLLIGGNIKGGSVAVQLTGGGMESMLWSKTHSKTPCSDLKRASPSISLSSRLPVEGDTAGGAGHQAPGGKLHARRATPPYPEPARCPAVGWVHRDGVKRAAQGGTGREHRTGHRPRRRHHALSVLGFSSSNASGEPAGPATTMPSASPS